MPVEIWLSRLSSSSRLALDSKKILSIVVFLGVPLFMIRTASPMGPLIILVGLDTRRSSGRLDNRRRATGMRLEDSMGLTAPEEDSVPVSVTDFRFEFGRFRLQQRGLQYPDVRTDGLWEDSQESLEHEIFAGLARLEKRREGWAQRLPVVETPSIWIRLSASANATFRPCRSANV
ncbi:hypothetical protein KCU87_g124, partial [Aureobasidium melanogenum]